MSDSHLLKAQRKLAIISHRRVRELLEGEYASIFKGRGLDFEDLRNYVPGDNVKDIDWRATARTGTPLIKQYITTRKHNFVFIVDTGCEMACLAPDGKPKKELGLLMFGALAYIAQRHGDKISLIAGNSDSIKLFHPTTRLEQIELMLRYADEQTTLSAKTQSLENLLVYLEKHVLKRSIVVMISDDVPRTETFRTLLKRLKIRHELMFVRTVDERPDSSNLRNKTVSDIDTGGSIIDELRYNKELSVAYDSWLAEDSTARTQMLRRAAVADVDIDYGDNVVPQLFRLLEQQKKRGRS